MPSEHDATEFVDDTYQPAGHTHATDTGWATTEAAPTLEQVDADVAAKNQRLAELRQAQEELERERTALEETRRRQIEFKKGREEMLHHLTRGVGLLEEAELTARRDAETAAKTLTDFKDALDKLQAINEQNWSKENFAVELTRALTTVENARMEWNSARVKIHALSDEIKTDASGKIAAATPAAPALATLGFWKLCKLGLALTWPLLLVALGALSTFIAILITRR